MSAKILQALTDENPDLQKQIGCMAGIFQLFDRHHILSGRRIVGHTPKRLPPGHTQLNGCSPSDSYPVQERNFIKDANENQRNSADTSRPSFSSSSCSSISSFECSKTAHSEPPFSESGCYMEPSSRNSPMSKLSDINGRFINSCRDQSKLFSPSGRESPDQSDVLKDPFYRDPLLLSVKTTPAKQPVKNVLKHQDSPRPMLLSRSVHEPGSVGVKGKPKIPSDINESLHVLAKLKEAPWFDNDVRKSLRSSERKDSSFLVSKDAPRFSYDGREASRPSIDSMEGSKSTVKQRELPRLSLDSRERSMRSCNSDTRSGKSNPVLSLNQEKEFLTKKKPPSVVAKLMGLEVLPDSSTASHRQIGCIKTSLNNDNVVDGETKAIAFSRSSKATEESNRDRSAHSPRSSYRDPVSPHFIYPDSVMKTISSSRFPIEAAPCGKHDCSYSPRRVLNKDREDSASLPTAVSVYSEIEKRLRELQFQQSGKDLRALKQILDAINAKGSEKKREDQALGKTSDDEHLFGFEKNIRLANKGIINSSHSVSNPIRGCRTPPRSLESPIVIMKPKKTMDRSNGPTSGVLSLNGVSSSLRKSPIADDKCFSINSQTVKESPSKSVSRKAIHYNLGSLNNKVNSKKEDCISEKSRPRSAKISSQPEAMTREGIGGSSRKSSGSLSPRLKKVDMEKRSCPPIHSVDLTKPRRQAPKQQPETVTPGGKYRLKPVHTQQQSDEQLADFSSDRRKLFYLGDELSVHSDSNISLVSQMDTEFTSADISAEIDFFHPRNNNHENPAQMDDIVSDTVYEKSLSGLGKVEFDAALTTAAPQQPSPVSVLDCSFYKDDFPPSPVKKLECPFEDNENSSSVAFSCEDGWNSIDLDRKHPDYSPSMNHKKLENVERLVQKLKRLNSAHDEVSKDHIALLCENTNPDHRYVSEILLASGLLLKDLSSGTSQIQLHPSGFPINPDLFLVLEQTKTSCAPKLESACKSPVCAKPKGEKLRRKLLFDTVNEVLLQKLALFGPAPEPWLQPRKLASMIPNGQRLLKELCLEIDHLQPDGLRESTDGCEEGLNSFWKDFQNEMSSLVLNIERSIFKELVDEIVNGESFPSPRSKPMRRRRQLFFK